MKEYLTTQALSGDVAALRELQRLGHDTREISSHPLHSAILHGDEIAVRALLWSYDVNETAEFGMNALHRACLMSEVNYNIIRMLLCGGPQLDAIDQYGNTFVHILSLHPNQELLDFIVDIIPSDADELTHLINIPNYQGITAAQHAAMRHDHQILHWLITHGANLNQTLIMCRSQDLI